MDIKEVKMSAKELRSLSLEELKEKWEALEEDLFNLRFQSATEDIQDPAGMRMKRRAVARLLTVIREKEIEAGLRKPKPKRIPRRKRKKKSPVK